jgi:hypothetical protein
VPFDFDAEERDTLRDTPEGELWTSVLVDALEDFQAAVKWLRGVYDRRRSQLDSALSMEELELPRYRERLRELEREKREQELQLRSCAWFFFDPDSPLDFICDALGYPVDLIREHARRTQASALELNGSRRHEANAEPPGRQAEASA